MLTKIGTGDKSLPAEINLPSATDRSRSEEMTSTHDTGELGVCSVIRLCLHFWLADRPFRRAVADTGALWLSATTRRLSATVQRRRDPRDRRSGRGSICGLQSARNRLICNARRCKRFARKPLIFQPSKLTLNQRVQGSSPCAPTTKKAKQITKLTQKILGQVVAS